MFGLGVTTLIILNEETDDIIKIVKSLEESGLIVKSARKITKSYAKEQKGEFLGMLVGALVASLLQNPLTDKGTITAGEETIRDAQDCSLIL